MSVLFGGIICSAVQARGAKVLYTFFISYVKEEIYNSSQNDQIHAIKNYVIISYDLYGKTDLPLDLMYILTSPRFSINF